MFFLKPRYYLSKIVLLKQLKLFVLFSAVFLFYSSTAYSQVYVDECNSATQRWFSKNFDVASDGKLKVEFTTDSTNSRISIRNTNTGKYIIWRVYNTFTNSYDFEAGSYKFIIRKSPSNSNVCIKISSDSEKVWYKDSDSDGYGDPNEQVKQENQPAGYVDNQTDCDDTNPSINPGATEVCNNLDDNCDGDADEGFATSKYYLDSDGDGYGDPGNFMEKCSQPVGYVVDNTDCDDNNPNIHPNAFDDCGTPIDENCSGSNDDCSEEPQGCAALSSIPLQTQVESAPPLVMLLLDDSGSMAWDLLCPENNGKFGGQAYVSNVPSYWKTQYHGYNGVYYDPDLDYMPWPDSAAKSYSDADPDYPKTHPNGTSTTNLNSSFDVYEGDNTTIRAHYFQWSTSKGKPYLVNLKSSGVDYYEITCIGGDCSDDRSRVDYITYTSNPPSDVIISRSISEERQNFANWYQYYRTRQLTAISALAQVVNTVNGMKIGIHTLNHRNGISLIAPKLIDESNEQNRKEILGYLYSVGASGGTPLRLALKAVGEFYKTGSLFASEADGGICQQAFTILMSDGYYNGNSPGVGNADGDNSHPPYDGSYFADSYSDTLADVAMHYYERDLSSTLEDLLSSSTSDPATHQHMVTYTVSFGLKGTLDPDSYNCPTNCPSWPSINNDDKKIDDMWHAAINGRGRYMAASNAQQLASSLTKLMSEVQHRDGTASSVAVSSQTLQKDTVVFEGRYNSEYWTGSLKAWNTEEKYGTEDGLKWSAGDLLDARDYTTRKIISYNDDTLKGIDFQYDQLSSMQKSTFGSNDTNAEYIINFIKGDKSNSSLRTRPTLLGDIVHSAPILYEDKLYVGANDGMFHAFDAETGDELFAYIPSFLYNYGKLKALADPDYQHKYYVDGAAATRNISSKKIIASGLGKGGKGYFALDITTPASFSKQNVLWEFPNKNTGTDDKKYMGYSYSQPVFLTTSDNKTVMIFGNGYDSEAGEASLFALTLGTDGSISAVNRIDTKYGNATDKCNGLSTPVVIDTNNDFVADTAYAGDLQGNVWKFDISSSNPQEWSVAFKDSGSGKSLFQAKDPSGDPQPITSKISIMSHCSDYLDGYILVFGTGSFMSVTDFDSTKIQSVYGIWDWTIEWEKAKANNASITIPDKFLGYPNPPSSGKRILSGVVSNSYINIDLNLVEQSQEGSLTESGFGLTSSNEVSFFNVQNYIQAKENGGTYAGGTDVGWYFNFPNTGERMVADAIIRSGMAIIVSLDPSSSPCETGGNSLLRFFNACTGEKPNVAVIDTDNDYNLDDETENVTNSEYDIPQAPNEDEAANYLSNVVQLDDIYYAPIIVTAEDVNLDLLYFEKPPEEKPPGANCPPDDPDCLEECIPQPGKPCDKPQYTRIETLGKVYWRIRTNN
jgi:type IV pilus assembly protein PilY1